MSLTDMSMAGTFLLLDRYGASNMTSPEQCSRQGEEYVDRYGLQIATLFFNRSFVLLHRWVSNDRTCEVLPPLLHQTAVSRNTAETGMQKTLRPLHFPRMRSAAALFRAISGIRRLSLERSKWESRVRSVPANRG